MLAEIILKVAGFEKEERQAYRPRPSSAGPERCIRQMVYHASGRPEDKTMADRFVMTIDDSSWHEYLTIDWINKTAFKLHSQQMKVETDGLSGSIDGIITDMLGTDRLFEHKALNCYSFERYWKGQFPLDYITQTAIYIKGLQKVNPEIDEAVLLIKNKNNAIYIDMIIRYERETDTAYVVEVTRSTGEKKVGDPYLLTIPSIVESALHKFALIEQHVNFKTLPERPFEFGTDFPCGYCSWEETCWGGYVEEVKTLAENEADLTELADSARFYKEIGGQMGAMEKQKDEVAASIKAKLRDLKARKGRAGEYLIDFRLIEGTKLKKKEDIPEDLLPRVTEPSIKEILYVNKFKEKKEKKEKKK